MACNDSGACSHCELPLGRFAQRREVNGAALEFCCYGCCLAYQFHHGASDEPEAAALLIRLGTGGFLAMNIMLFSLLLYGGAFSGDEAWVAALVPWLLWGLATPVFVVLGGPFLAGAWSTARRGRLNADSLVSLGALAAYLYSAWQVIRGSRQVYFDTATMVLLLFTLGRYLEAQGRVRAARSLAPMLAAERAEVRVLCAGREAIRPVTEARAGDLVRVLPGERIAVDGVILEGRSECDESCLTGQPEPQPKAPGDAVLAGSLNGAGPLLVWANAGGGETRWIRIGRLVREALARKSPLGETLDRAAALFVPWVLLLALASFWFWADRGTLDQALAAALAVLVVACPCSLGLAAPLAMSLGIGRAAERGILVRGGGVLERLSQLKGIAFDKTGTLTLGHPRVLDVRVDGAGEPLVLRRAQSLLLGSEHPIAQAILALRADGNRMPATAQDARARPGAGMTGQVDGAPCAIGSASLMAELGWPIPSSLAPTTDGCHTLVYVGWDGRVAGCLSVADSLRPEAAEVVASLRASGLRQLLLSGDRQPAVAGLAAALGISDWRAGLSPEEKVVAIRRWTAVHGPTAMVGDGLNDGPVLAASSVGIAVGGAADLAKESADVILPPDGLTALPWLLDLAQQVRRSVRANLLWAFGYNAVALALAASGTLRPVLAAGLMAGSSLVVVARSLRAARRTTPAVAQEAAAARLASAAVAQG